MIEIEAMTSKYLWELNKERENYYDENDTANKLSDKLKVNFDKIDQCQM